MLKERSNLCSARQMRAYVAFDSGVPTASCELEITQADLLLAVRSIFDSVLAEMQNARCREAPGVLKRLAWRVGALEPPIINAMSAPAAISSLK
jgi:hypothetical protein